VLERGDDGDAAAYEHAKRSYIRAATHQAEGRLRDRLARRRATLRGEIADLRELIGRRQAAAAASAASYAAHLPHRVRPSGVRPPSMWERLRASGEIDALYRRAAKAAADLADATDLLRSRCEHLDRLEREARHAISSREEAVRRKLHTPEGLAVLHDDPLVRMTLRKLQPAARPDDADAAAARDRDMLRRGQQFATVPLQGVIIARVVRYGPLAYYVLRDLAHRESLLACDPALEPLRDVVFDLSVSAAGYEAALRHLPDEQPMRVRDHLATCYRGDAFEAALAAHRRAMREDRPLRATAPRDATESEMIAMLRLLAQAVANHAT
jgi:hypothetical protein